MINYAISPASQNPATFVVSTAFNPFRARLTEVLANDAAEQAREKSTLQAQFALEALIKPGWLIGRWVEASQGSEACANGPYNQFQPAGQFSEDNASGKWQMEDQAMTVILLSATLTFLVADATMNTFTMELENGNQVNIRRCAADAVRLPSTGVAGEAVVPTELASTLSPDANMME